jgi:hypothetical protein
MAACIDSKLGEYQAAATAASRSASETDEAVKSWADHHHHIDYVEVHFDRSRRRDRLIKCSDNDTNINHRENDGELQQEKKSFSRRETRVADKADISINHDTMKRNIYNNVASDRETSTRKKEKKNRSDQEGTSESALSSQDEIEEYKKVYLLKRDYASETVLGNEYSDEQEARAARAVKVPIAAANNNVNSPSKSACFSRNTNRAINDWNKRGDAGDTENHKDDCDETEPMEITSSQNRGYPRGDDVVASASATSRDKHREILWGEVTSKIIRTSNRDNHVRSPGKTRRCFARNANQADATAPETDTIVRCTEEGRKCGRARKCENCGELHSPHSSAYLSRDASENGANRKDAGTGIAAPDRETDSGGLTAPTTMLYRSRSLPRLLVHDSGIACSDHAAAAPERTHAASRQLVSDLRQLLTLKQHYYPEGGWGWIVLLAGLLVQILSHGAHGSVGVFLEQVVVKFGPHVHEQTG